MELVICEERPDGDDIIALLRLHLAHASAASPPDHVHALDVEGLSASDMTFLTARRDGVLLGVGALRDLGQRQAEIKSMHTAVTARGQGVGGRILDHLTAIARDRGVTWLGLETGTMDEFAAARRLYEAADFLPCRPYGPYTVNPHSVCMARTLGASGT